MSEPGRLRLLQAVAAGAFLLLALQLVRLQLIDATRYAGTASNEHLRATDIGPPRGLIYDRNGVPVASNVPRFSVSLVPGELPPEAIALRSALVAVERHTGLPYGELERVVARGLDAVDPLAPVPVLDVGLTGAWDDLLIFASAWETIAPSEMWYEGEQAITNNIAIGYATHP